MIQKWVTEIGWGPMIDRCRKAPVVLFLEVVMSCSYGCADRAAVIQATIKKAREQSAKAAAQTILKRSAVVAQHAARDVRRLVQPRPGVRR